MSPPFSRKVWAIFTRRMSSSRQSCSRRGWFAQEHKKPLPAMPEKIALITSGAGAAVQDMIRILGRRWPLTKILVMRARAGNGSPREIAGAIRYANRWNVADLIITGRGGGSIEDLWAFNDERVARAIFASEIPVISAVGHEPDVTIADFVADVRAATPSNGAEIAVPEQADVRALLLLAGKPARSGGAEAAGMLSPPRLNELSGTSGAAEPDGLSSEPRLDVDRLSDRLNAAEKHLLLAKRQEYVRLVSSLEAMSPLRVLARGFSVATDASGAILRDAKAVAPGDSVHIRLEHGALDCRVEHQSEVQ